MILPMSPVRPVKTVDNSHCADEVSTCVVGNTNGNKALMSLSSKEEKQHSQVHRKHVQMLVHYGSLRTISRLLAPCALASHHPAPRAISYCPARRAALSYILSTPGAVRHLSPLTMHSAPRATSQRPAHCTVLNHISHHPAPCAIFHLERPGALRCPSSPGALRCPPPPGALRCPLHLLAPCAFPCRLGALRCPGALR
eukprot:6212372-Pleurochrysis_carterae.AAC.1